MRSSRRKALSYPRSVTCEETYGAQLRMKIDNSTCIPSCSSSSLLCLPFYFSWQFASCALSWSFLYEPHCRLHQETLSHFASYHFLSRVVLGYLVILRVIFRINHGPLCSCFNFTCFMRVCYPFRIAFRALVNSVYSCFCLVGTHCNTIFTQNFIWNTSDV